MKSQELALLVGISEKIGKLSGVLEQQGKRIGGMDKRWTKTAEKLRDEICEELKAVKEELVRLNDVDKKIADKLGGLKKGKGLFSWIHMGWGTTLKRSMSIASGTLLLSAMAWGTAFLNAESNYPSGQEIIDAERGVPRVSISDGFTKKAIMNYWTGGD